MKALSIGYHDVLEPGASAAAPPDVLLYCLDRGDFCEHLGFIGRRARRAIKTITGFHPWEGEVPLFLTFDDGGAGMFTCAIDELELRGWRGHFFITTDWIGKPGFLTARQIREIHERGHVIGSHSCSHPARMSHLAWNDLKREWGVSCARLADIVGARIAVASVPDGYHSPKVAEAAALCGIEALFTSEPTSRVGAVNRCLVLGRYTVLRGTRPALSGALAAGHLWPRWRQAMAWQAKKAVKNVAGEHYLRIRQALLTRGVFGA